MTAGKSHLSDFTNEDRELIVGLPYRVGIWMGNAEDEGGDEDDAREVAALRKIIYTIARNEKTPAFVRELFDETLSCHDRWPSWAEDTFDILPDCERAVGILGAKSSKADRNNFKKALKKIAFSVAGAHGEFGEFDDGTGEGLIGRLLKRVKGGGGKTDDFMNISPAEEESLRSLAVVLRPDENN